jgi:hypothetical protein
MTTKSTTARATRSTTTKTEPKKAAIKRQPQENKTVEYIASNAGAVFMLMQSGVTIFDEELKRVREIRYCEREHSIYKDEQSENSVKTPVIFRMGRLFVTPDKPNLLAFLEAHPQNKANGGSRFERVDKEKKAEVTLDDEFLVVDAVSLIRTKELDDLLAVALSFGIDVDRPVSEIKHDLLQKAKKSPKVFIQSFDNPVVAMKAMVKQAESFQILSVMPDSVRWHDTNKLIISVPAGQDPIDVFVRYCLTEAASPVVSEIERQLNI